MLKAYILHRKKKKKLTTDKELIVDKPIIKDTFCEIVENKSNTHTSLDVSDARYFSSCHAVFL